MPRYFFDVNDGTEHRDEIGRSLDGDVDVKGAALKLAVALAKVEADDAKDALFTLSVRTESGALALRVRMACQVEDVPVPLSQAE